MKRDWNKPAVVYMHTSPEGKSYIGVTTKVPPSHRWGEGGRGYSDNQEFMQDILRLGWENFTHQILAHCDSALVAFKIETELIHLYQTTDPDHGYNHITGSKYCGEISPTMRSKFQARSRNRIWVHKNTQEKSIKLSELPTYLDSGWQNGRPLKYVIYVNKGNECRRANLDTLQGYLDSGWKLGKTTSINQNIKRSRQQFIWYFDDKEFVSASELAKYMRLHGYPKIAPSTLTAAFNGQTFAAYPDLLQVVHRMPIMKEGAK